MAECGILNLGSCLPQAFFEFILTILNAPVQPFLNLTKNLLTEPINISIFSSIWAIIIYLLSMFYALFLLYSGIQFMISGHDVAKRENAKTWLRNIIIMIVLIQASYFIYQLAIDLSSAMSTATISLIDNNFFLLTADNLSSLALQLFFSFFYVITLLFTSLILIIRYAIVAIGVIFFPIAILFYFFDPLKEYGALILNFLGITLFITFFDSIILLGFSKLLEIGTFQEVKILVMIAGFTVINLMMFFMTIFALIKSGLAIYTKVQTIVTGFV